MIVIYPNNDITVDGYALIWTESEWARHRVNQDRPVPPHKVETAMHRTIDGQPAVIFPTRVVGLRQARGTKAQPEAHDPVYGKRAYQVRDGVVYIYCGGKNGCDAWKPTADFTKRSYSENRWFHICRICNCKRAREHNRAYADVRSRAKVRMMIRIQQEVAQHANHS